jgi:16S rRNA processing protein RimM
MPERRILMGVVGRPHGVRGLVHVHSYTADPADLSNYGALFDDKGQSWSVRWRSAGIAELRDASGKPLADRNAAEALVNLRLHIDRDRLPAPDEEEYYLADLVGLAARDEAGQEIGQVALVHDYGAGASLEISRPNAAPLLVPFTRWAVPLVDIAGGFITIVPPAEIAGEERPGEMEQAELAQGGTAA